MKSFYYLLPVGLLALLLLSLRLPAAAQAPAWQSARAVAVATAAATSNSSDVRATAVDGAGNIFLAGNFTNTVVLGGTTLTSLGSVDVFVAKFNPASNQFVWAQRAGGTDYDVTIALAISGTSVYVAGYFRSSTADFGTATLTNAGANTRTNDLFVAKLTDAGSTGSLAWAQRAGGTGDDYATVLAVSGTNVYIAGNYGSPTASFGTTTLTNVGGNNYSDVFVAKLTDTGSFVWAQRGGGTRADGATALAINGTSVYVAGNFNGLGVSFGTTTLTNASANSNDFDVFVAKLIDAGSTGSFAWAQQAGGTGNEIAAALTLSGTSVYVAGSFSSPTASFGPITLPNVGVNNYYDVFVTKLTDMGSTGSFAWAQRAGGTGNDDATALAVSGTSVYVAGSFQSLSADFGATALANTGANGTSDVFVAKLTDTGTSSFTWAQRAGGTWNDAATALAVSGTNVYVAGYIQSPTADFGTTILSASTSNSNTFGFLASLTDPTLTATATGHTMAPAQLYPNPAHHAATLRLPAGTVPTPLTLRDALGRPVRRYPAPAGPEATLDLRGLPAGLYLLRGAGPAQRLVVE